HFDPGAEEYRLLVKFRASESPLRAGGLGKVAGMPGVRFRSALDVSSDVPPDVSPDVPRNVSPNGSDGLVKASGNPILAAFAGLVYVEVEPDGAGVSGGLGGAGAAPAVSDKHALKALGER